jgi:hypothetical protein
MLTTTWQVMIRYKRMTWPYTGCGQERIWIADLDVDDDNLLPTLRVLEGRGNDNGSPAERSRDMRALAAGGRWQVAKGMEEAIICWRDHKP